jgi:SAM-dependent methyltransferase
MGLWDRTRAWATNSETVRRWRLRRYQRFVELCRVEPDERIVDVGAGVGGALERFNSTNPIIAVDIALRAGARWLDGSNVTFQVADGTALPFQDNEFAVAFSSSVIEHIPRDLRPAFAAEIRRVATRYFVQTPNRYFPIEPHYQLPFFQFLPKGVQRGLSRRFTLGWYQRGSWEEIELLSARDLRRLFPEATIHRERLFGLTKSLMAVRG